MNMSVNSKTTLKIALHVAFCVAMIILFGSFCKLRTVAAGHIYKEYLSGVIAIGMMYFNAFVLFPVFFKTNRVPLYLLTGMASAIAACLIEMAMVSKDLISVLQIIVADNEIHKYLLTDSLYVLLRDIVLFFFSFSASALTYYATINQNKEMTLVKSLHQLEAKTDDKQKSDIHVSILLVAYALQNGNYTYLYLTSGGRVFRYGSLKKLMILLDDDSYVQLSTKIIAMCNNVLRYDSSGVVVKASPKSVLLTYSPLYKDKAMGELFAKTGLDPNEGASEKRDKPRLTPRHQSREKSEKLILNFISEHPGCSAAEIKKNRSISLSTVNRILADLKKEDRIEYVGSKKTGGYYLVNIPQESEVAEPVLQEEACSISS